jgi:hypothetical protein
MTFSHTEDKQLAVLDLTGVVLDDKGKPVASFNDRLDVSFKRAQDDERARRKLVYNFQSPLKPGLYQARVAVRDSKGGRLGSAMQWIEVPDISLRQLSLSSLLLGETTKESQTQKDGQTSINESPLSVDHHFSRTSKLRFLTYIYNAAKGADQAAPDLALQVQVLRDDQPVATTPLRKIEINEATDLARILYAAELPLETMLPGAYVLQVTVIDRLAKTSVSQRASFVID